MKSIIFLSTVLLLASCSKNKNDAKGASGVEVYVSGFQYTEVKKTFVPYTISEKRISTVWKNRTAIALADTSHNSYASAIAASNNDIYVIGNDKDAKAGSDFVKYWKNGVGVNLADEGALIASGISVANGDVYALAFQDLTLYDINLNYTAEFFTRYWKNGAVHSVPFIAKAIAAVGEDLYIGGTDRSQHPCLWKNGSLATLSGDPGLVQAIVISGADVFCAGEEGGKASLWKNGVLLPLQLQDRGSSLSGVAVVKNDVYVSGYEYNQNGQSVAKYWKNGVPTILATAASASGIAITGNDVYVSGEENASDGIYIPKYWKNGVGVELSKGGLGAKTTGIVAIKK